MGVMARFFEKNEHIPSSQHSIECGSCGKTEKFPTSKQRQESKVFEWLNNKGSYAYYKCRCGKQTLSKIVQIEICPNTCKVFRASPYSHALFYLRQISITISHRSYQASVILPRFGIPQS